MNRSNTVGMPSLRTPPSGFGISTRFTGFGLYIPLRSCSRMVAQCCFRWSPSWLTVIPATPGAPLFALTRHNASFRFSRSTISSIVRSAPAGLSGTLVVGNDSDPSLPALRASPFGEKEKSRLLWMFCRMSLLRLMSYLPLLSFGPSITVPGSAYLLTPPFGFAVPP